MDHFSNTEPVSSTSFGDHYPLPPILNRLMDRLASVGARGYFLLALTFLVLVVMS